MDAFDPAEAANRLMVQAARGWHFQPDQWRLTVADDARALAGAAAAAALDDLNALLSLVAEHASRDVMLRPPQCRRWSPDERLLADALEAAMVDDFTGARAALADLLDGSALARGVEVIGRLAARFAPSMAAPSSRGYAAAGGATIH